MHRQLRVQPSPGASLRRPPQRFGPAPRRSAWRSPTSYRGRRTQRRKPRWMCHRSCPPRHPTPRDRRPPGQTPGHPVPRLRLLGRRSRGRQRRRKTPSLAYLIRPRASRLSAARSRSRPRQRVRCWRRRSPRRRDAEVSEWRGRRRHRPLRVQPSPGASPRRRPRRFGPAPRRLAWRTPMSCGGRRTQRRKSRWTFHRRCAPRRQTSSRQTSSRQTPRHQIPRHPTLRLPLRGRRSRGRRRPRRTPSLMRLPRQRPSPLSGARWRTRRRRRNRCRGRRRPRRHGVKARFASRPRARNPDQPGPRRSSGWPRLVSLPSQPAPCVCLPACPMPCLGAPRRSTRRRCPPAQRRLQLGAIPHRSRGSQRSHRTRVKPWPRRRLAASRGPRRRQTQRHRRQQQPWSVTRTGPRPRHHHLGRPDRRPSARYPPLRRSHIIRTSPPPRIRLKPSRRRTRGPHHRETYRPPLRGPSRERG